MSGRLHEDADALSRYPIAEKGTDDEEDELLPVFTAAWETEKKRIREGQEAIPSWKKHFYTWGGKQTSTNGEK